MYLLRQSAMYWLCKVGKLHFWRLSCVQCVQCMCTVRLCVEYVYSYTTEKVNTTLILFVHLYSLNICTEHYCSLAICTLVQSQTWTLVQSNHSYSALYTGTVSIIVLYTPVTNNTDCCHNFINFHVFCSSTNLIAIFCQTQLTNWLKFWR